MHVYGGADSSISDIEEAFKGFTSRDDIAILLINQNVRSLHCQHNIVSIFISILPMMS